MNFDDLHDPDPPRPGSATLAAVAGRARQIRRRRTALVAAGSALAALAVVVPTALVVTGEDSTDRMIPATVPIDPASTPETTTAPPPTAAPTASAAPTTNPVPSSTVPASRPTVVAIRANGDAVAIDAEGVETVLYDEPDPPPDLDPSAEFGDAIGVDSIAVTGDGRQFVALCCEPVAGSWFEVGDERSIRYGRRLDVSPDGSRLAAAGASFVGVFAPDGTVIASADLSADALFTQFEQAMWLDDDTLVLLAFQDGPTFRLLTVDAGLGDVDPSAGAVIAALPSPEAAWPVLAGVGDDGSILVFQGAGGGLQYATSTLQAFDPMTLERRPGSDVSIPEPALFAWFEGGLLTWIREVDLSLHVGDSEVPGEFLWARPILG